MRILVSIFGAILGTVSAAQAANQFGETRDCQTQLGSDSTESAKTTLVHYFKDDPEHSLEKNWKRVKKWKENNKVYRSFRSNSGRQAFVVYDPGTKTNSVFIQQSQVASTPNTQGVVHVDATKSVKPKLPPHHFIFAIDHVGMSADDSGHPSVVIMTRNLFEEESWVPDHMESEDVRLLRPVLDYLGLRENMSNEFQMTFPIAVDELKKKLSALGLDYDEDLQSVVDQMGEM